MRGPNEKRTERSRALRQQDNSAEGWLWQGLRNRLLNGWKFVRQTPIGPYFADFACRELMLVVELDGSQHVGNHDDQARNRYMNEAGWSVARFWSGQVQDSRSSALETIAAICEGRISEYVNEFDFQFYPAKSLAMTTKDAPHPNPLPAGGEREKMRPALYRPDSTNCQRHCAKDRARIAPVAGLLIGPFYALGFLIPAAGPA
ncbi:MAG: DUF559 domain-containing protein [Asticcacaulis sp.]|nr:DUF559 domain-containing protein [Asticcacaulis sp.]